MPYGKSRPHPKVAQKLPKILLLCATLVNMRHQENGIVADTYPNRLEKASDCDSDTNISLITNRVFSKSESTPISAVWLYYPAMVLTSGSGNQLRAT